MLFAGALNARKGADLLPVIYQYSAAAIPNLELEIIGEGELYADLKEAFEGMPAVRLSGWKPRDYVLGQMRKASVFLFPSRAEGLPNVLLEALSVGTIPVASDIESGIPDIVTHKTNGLLVEPGNAKLFAGSIFELYNDRELMLRLQNNSLTTLEKFEPSRQSAKYEKIILDTVVNRKKREFPLYKKGRVLDIKWMPGLIVIFLRKLFKIPEL